MKRIYLESFLGLIILFVASLVGYEVIVYQLNTDYDYLLEEALLRKSVELNSKLAI